MDRMQIDYLLEYPQYLETLAGWLHGEWGGLYEGATLETRIADLSGLMQRDTTPFAMVAHQDGAPLGTASLIVSDLETRPDLTPWLASVFVPPEFRRRGIAARLVTAVTQAAARMGLDRYYLWTDKQAAYYAAMGWTPLFDQEYRGLNITVMEYHLKSVE